MWLGAGGENGCPAGGLRVGVGSRGRRATVTEIVACCPPLADSERLLGWWVNPCT